MSDKKNKTRMKINKCIQQSLLGNNRFAAECSSSGQFKQNNLKQILATHTRRQ